MHNGPSLGMVKRRKRLAYKLRPPWLAIGAMLAALCFLWLLVLLHRSNPGFRLSGKAGFLWLLPPIFIAGCMVKIIAWPFRIPGRRRELARLRQFDRLEDFERAERQAGR